MPEQRLRVAFQVLAPLKFLSHLDLMRLWSRALRRAELPVAYSEGFNPRPRLAVAAPLPVGVAGLDERLDLDLTEVIDAETFRRRLNACLPEGLTVLSAETVAPHGPSLTAGLIAADFRVTFLEPVAAPDARTAVDRVLTAETLPRARLHRGRPRPYDLRPLILDLRLEAGPAETMLWMRLAAAPGATARPDEVLAELGLAAISAQIDRVALYFAPERTALGPA